jgi:hypothetical protein
MLHYFGVSSIGISGCATTGGLAPGFPGSRNSETPSSNMLHYFGVSSIGISRVGGLGLANTWGPHLGTPGAEIPKYDNFSTLYLSGYRKSGFRDLRVQGKLTLGSSGFEKPKCQIKSHYANSGFRESGFGNFAIQEARSFTLLDYPKLEKPIHPLIIHFTKLGFLILANQYLPMLVQVSKFRRAQTGGLAPRPSGSRNSEIQTLKPAHLFRDFTHWNFAGRGFGTCEYKGLASRYPGYRNSEILYLLHTIIISGFRKSGFRDLRVQGNTPLGIPGSETPKCPNSSTRRHFGFS